MSRTLREVSDSLEKWADQVGYDARKAVVPKWAKPTVTTPAGVANHPLVAVDAQATMFDVRTVERTSRSKAKKHHRYDKPQGA